MTEVKAKEQLLAYFRERVELSKEEEAQITSAYTFKEFEKKEHVFEQFKPLSLEAFVVQGTFRVYYIDQKGDEHVLYFAFPNWWIGDMITFHKDETASFSGQALEKSIALTIDKQSLEQLFFKCP